MVAVAPRVPQALVQYRVMVVVKMAALSHLFASQDLQVALLVKYLWYHDSALLYHLFVSWEVLFLAAPRHIRYRRAHRYRTYKIDVFRTWGIWLFRVKVLFRMMGIAR